VASGVSDRSDDSTPSGRVSAWVSDGAEGTGVKRILQLDEEQDVTSRLEEVRAVSALHHPRHPATVLTPVRKSC
jgi:hypothetical protein